MVGTWMGLDECKDRRWQQDSKMLPPIFYIILSSLSGIAKKHDRFSMQFAYYASNIATGAVIQTNTISLYFQNFSSVFRVIHKVKDCLM
jgi:hypothetical protein